MCSEKQQPLRAAPVNVDLSSVGIAPSMAKTEYSAMDQSERK